jgi:predicted ABC-type ATPase
VPDLHIIAGPNGVGKTTFANVYRPLFKTWKLFLNDGMTPRLLAVEKDGRLVTRDRKAVEEILQEAGLVL